MSGFNTWDLFLIAFVTAAAVGDVRWGRIPRQLTVVGFASGLLYHGWRGEIGTALGAAVLAFLTGIVLFRLGAIGGGDVKLMTALGAMLGLHDWLRAMYVAVLVAAIIAVVQIVRAGVVRRTVVNMGAILNAIGREGLQAHPTLHVRNPALVRSPFGLAAALGTVVAVIR